MFWWCCTRSEPTPAASLCPRHRAHRRVPWTCLASGRAHPPSRRHRPWLGRSHVLERAWPRHPLPRHLGTAPQPQHLGTAPQPPLEPRNLDLESSNVGLVRLAGAGQLLLSGGNCLVRGPTRRRHADTTLLIRRFPPNSSQSRHLGLTLNQHVVSYNPQITGRRGLFLSSGWFSGCCVGGEYVVRLVSESLYWRG